MILTLAPSAGCRLASADFRAGAIGISMPDMLCSAARIVASGKVRMERIAAAIVVFISRLFLSSAPGIAAQARQFFRSQDALVATAVDDPGGVADDLHLMADRRFGAARPIRAAFDVGQAVGGRAGQSRLYLAKKE